jgi:hypothetical protein
MAKRGKQKQKGKPQAVAATEAVSGAPDDSVAIEAVEALAVEPEERLQVEVEPADADAAIETLPEPPEAVETAIEAVEAAAEAVPTARQKPARRASSRPRDKRSPFLVLGVANVRGTLLPVVDLKQFLEGERTVLHESQRVLVVRQPGGDVAVTIDELYGQRSFVDGQGIEVESVSEGRYAYFIDRAYRVNDQDWGVFSLDRLARTPEFRQAAA